MIMAFMFDHMYIIEHSIAIGKHLEQTVFPEEQSQQSYLTRQSYKYVDFYDSFSFDSSALPNCGL